MTAAARAFVGLRRLGIEVTARRLPRRLLALLVGRIAARLLVHVEPVLAGWQPFEVGRERDAALGLLDCHGAGGLPDAVRRDEVERDLDGLGGDGRRTDAEERQGGQRGENEAFHRGCLRGVGVQLRENRAAQAPKPDQRHEF